MNKKITLTVMVIFMSMCLTSCTNKNKSVSLEDKLVYHISFDEESKYVLESKSNQTSLVNYVFNDALYKQDTYAKRANGINNKALLFDGYSTYIEANKIPTLSSDFAISFYLAPRAFETRPENSMTTIFSNIDNATGLSFSLGNYGKWLLTLNTSKGTYKILNSDYKIDLYKWNNIVINYQSKNNGSVSIYKNKELMIEYKLNGAKPLSSTSRLLFGKTEGAGVQEEIFELNHYSGLMDEFKVYDTSLQKSDIDKMYVNKAIDIKEDLWLDPTILADDRYKPTYHMSTAQNWQNESYGCFYYEGKYHVFFQQNVMGPFYASGQRYGHMVSDDLVHWEEVTPALIPEENNIDENDVFSGCSILDKNGNPVIFYTGVTYDSDNINLISKAIPSDLSDPYLTNWVKLGQPVLSQGNLSTKNNFRDPYVYQENGTYYMFIGGTNTLNNNNGAIFCYKATSNNLDNWEYLGITYSGNTEEYSFLGDCYELPNLLKVQNKDKTITKYLLMISPINGSGNGAYYFLGDFDLSTGKFTPESSTPMKFDYAPKDQILCPSGFYDVSTDRNIIFTMSRTNTTAEDRYNSGWTNIITLCKEVTLDDFGNLMIKPIEEYEQLKNEQLISLSNVSVEDANTQLTNVKGDTLKIELEIKPNNDTLIGLYVKYDYDGIERLFISYDLNENYFYVDNSKSSTIIKNNGSGGGNIDIKGENIVLTVYVDRAMVEAYLNDYKEITTFSFNQSSTSNGVMLYSNGNSARVISLKIYSLNSAYGQTIPAYWE